MNSENMLSYEVCEDVIDEFASMGGRLLMISGGEPTLHKELVKILKYSKSRDLAVYLYTNGYNFIKETIDYVDRFYINLQGGKKTHNELCGKDCYDRTISTIQKLKEHDEYVGVHVIVNRKNIDELSDLCEECIILGIDEVGIMKFFPQGRGYENKDFLEINDENEVRNINEEYDFVKLRCPYNLRKCRAGVKKITVRPDYSIRLCPAIKQQKSGDLRMNRRACEELYNS